MGQIIQLSEMNRRIIINSYLFGQDTAGGNTKTLLVTYPAWARVTQTSGSRLLEERQITYQKAYEIIKRHVRQRPVEKDNDEIVYESAILSIANVEVVSEGNKIWEKITAYSTAQLAAGGELDILCEWYATEW
jgi:Phage head-tail joining protein.